MVYRSKTPRMRLESHPLDAPSEELDGERGDSALSLRIAGIRYLTLRGSYFLASVLWDIPARTRDDLRLNQRRSALRRGDRSQHRRPARSRGHHAGRGSEATASLRSHAPKHGSRSGYAVKGAEGPCPPVAAPVLTMEIARDYPSSAAAAAATASVTLPASAPSP